MCEIPWQAIHNCILSLCNNYGWAVLKRRGYIRGFTLIELSIVLVVIGMIVGGILVGQSLIAAAEVRAQITQIEKYNLAVNTFRGKFGYLPGDMVSAAAQQFGFLVGVFCTGQQGGRDGNGVLDGWATSNYTLGQGVGETALFWQDLSSTTSGNLIDGQYPNGSIPAFTCWQSPNISITGLSQIFPPAKIGRGNYVYVYEGNSINWFGLSQVTSTYGNGNTTSGTNILVYQAFSIDLKIDDGFPQTGNIQTNYLNNSNGGAIRSSPNTATSGGTSSSCYDTTTGAYSITVNNGNGGNCALSFRFQ